MTLSTSTGALSPRNYALINSMSSNKLAVLINLVQFDNVRNTCGRDRKKLIPQFLYVVEIKKLKT